MSFIKKTIEESSAIKLDIIKFCLNDIQATIDLMISAIREKKKIIWCGNGGSAADAQHMAAELMGGLVSHSRKPISSIALTTDTSFITAWANDTDYNTIFSRQIEGLGNSGDILVAISTSGNSINIFNAIQTANNMGLKVVILNGRDGGKIKDLGDTEICIPSNNTQRIQEGHLLVEHIICESIEASIIENPL